MIMNMVNHFICYVCHWCRLYRMC